MPRTPASDICGPNHVRTTKYSSFALPLAEVKINILSLKQGQKHKFIKINIIKISINKEKGRKYGHFFIGLIRWTVAGGGAGRSGICEVRGPNKTCGAETGKHFIKGAKGKRPYFPPKKGRQILLSSWGYLLFRSMILL